MNKVALSQQELDQHLFSACIEGNHDYALLALAAGANVNAKDKTDRTPLHKAAMFGHTSCAGLLLDKGANVHASDSIGRTPYRCAMDNDRKQVAKLLANAAKHHGHAARVEHKRDDKGPPQVGG